MKSNDMKKLNCPYKESCPYQMIYECKYLHTENCISDY